MTSGKMPRRFWSYTAGKGDLFAEEREATRARLLKGIRETLPGLMCFGIILVLAVITLLMMFAEFRGFKLDQMGELFRVRR